MTTELSVSRSFQQNVTKITIKYSNGPRDLKAYIVLTETHGRGVYSLSQSKASGLAFPISASPGNTGTSGTVTAQFPGNKQYDFDVWFVRSIYMDHISSEEGPVPTGIYRNFLYMNGNKSVKFDLAALPPDVKLNDLMNKAGLTPPDTASAGLNAVVMGATVLAAFFGVLATVASGGSAAPIALAIVGGLASTGGNAAWLFWPTDHDALWKAVDTVSQTVNKVMRDLVDAKLKSAREVFNANVTGVQEALDHVDDPNFVSRVDDAHDKLNVVNPILVEARRLMINFTGTQTDYDPNYPDAFLKYFMEYIDIHFRVLIAMCMLSDEVNGRTGAKSLEVTKELDLVNPFLSESRDYLVKTLRKRQERARAPWGIASQFVGKGGTSWYVSKNGEWLKDHIFKTEKEVKAERDRRANADSTACFEKDKQAGYLATFNTLVSAFKQFMQTGITVAPIADFEAKL